ncbi:hypothetical protein [Barrientosiimonas humi]|uniref:hypothetical protein n=1 Tax=Barrientosiimonas humi TaxID=999931 RepID=UPI0014773E6B|nr:hypothetical protein [Barrientosiimonas humi]
MSTWSTHGAGAGVGGVVAAGAMLNQYRTRDRIAPHEPRSTPPRNRAKAISRA